MATVSDTTQTVTGLFRSLGSVARNTGFLITAASGVAAAALVTLSTRANQVNAAFREVNSITGFVTDSQEKYGELVSELNTEFGLQIDQLGVIDGLYQSLSAGIADTEEAQRAFLTTAANLAKVGLVDLETSVDVVSTILNTYGKSASQADEVSMRLFETVQLGKVRLEELAPVMGRVAALGSSMGIEFVELSGAMAQLTRTGFEARVAATGLRNVIRALIKPSEQMQETLLNIAAEQDFFADSLGSTSDKARSLASDYRSLTDSLDRYNEKQKEAREAEEEASLAIQEARLKISAIEQNRLSQLPELTSEVVKQADSISDLESVINDERFAVNKARVQTEKYRRESEKTKEEISELKQNFTEQVDAAGNLEGGIGELFAQNQGLTETLVDLKERVDETSMSMSDVFPRTRALQAALALVGSEGNNLVDIMQKLENDSLNIEEAFNSLTEETKEGFGDTPEQQLANFRDRMEELQGIEDFDELIGGGTGRLRDSLSRIQEAATQLGNVFNEEVTNALEAIGNGLSRLTNFLTNLEEDAQNTISQFTVLAVSLGLIIGPALLVVGVAALLAQALGPALIPIVGALAAFIGVLSSVFLSVKQDGEEANSTIDLLRNVFNKIRSAVTQLIAAFNLFVSKDIATFGEAIIDVFNSLFTTLDSGDIIRSLVASFLAIGDSIRQAGNFISNNSDQIASAILKIVEIGAELGVFFKGLLDVFIQFVTNPLFQGILKILIGSIVALISVTADVLAFIGKWLSNNKELVATIIDISIVLASLAAAAYAVVGAIGVLIGWFVGAFTLTGLLTGALGTVGSVIASLIPFFGILSSAVSILITGFTLLIAAAKIVVGAIAGIISIKLILIGIIVALIASVWFFRDQIVAAFKNAFATLGKLFDIFVDLIQGKLSLEEAGKKMMKTLEKGIKNHLGILDDAMKKVSSTIDKYLPGSNAEIGALSDLKGSGKAIPETLGEQAKQNKSAAGEGASEVSKIVEENLSVDIPQEEITADDMVDPEAEMNKQQGDFTADGVRSIGGESSDTSMPDMGSKEINVNEKAIFFQKGAFQGVSDEELPGKVRRIIDQSTTEIIKDLEAKGVEVDE